MTLKEDFFSVSWKEVKPIFFDSIISHPTPRFWRYSSGLSEPFISFSISLNDGGNDISMLKYVGTGVAMGNAKDNVKAIADYITDSVQEDGIVSALKHFEIL